MIRRDFFRGALAAALCVLLSTGAFAAGAAAAIAAKGRPASLAGVSGAVSPAALRAFHFHLDAAALRLGAVLPSLPGPSAGETAAGYLLEQSLFSPKAAAESVEAARALGASLADALRRGRLAESLAASGTAPGRSAARKLREIGARVEGLAEFRELAARLAAGRFAEIFDGRSGAPAAPEDFARYAAGRFSRDGVLAPAVAARENRGPPSLPSDEELQERVALSPLTNPERERVIVELFKKAGARPEEIRLQDAGYGRNNIFVVKPGRGDRVVVVGGHHDKVRRGAGTIDNWTGATLVVNLYQALRGLDTEATYVFVAFSREEEGLLGSRYFLSRLSGEERAKIDSMINLDTLAVDGTFSWKNNSDRGLLRRIMEAAGRGGHFLKEMTLWGGDADSSTFRRAGIPAMTVLGASNEVIWDIIHSDKDTFARFSPPHYKNAYLLVRDLLLDLDKNPLRRGWLSWIRNLVRAVIPGKAAG